MTLVITNVRFEHFLPKAMKRIEHLANDNIVFRYSPEYY
jgi:hypothetical protein